MCATGHKNPTEWSVQQTRTMRRLSRSDLKTVRAWRIIYATATTSGKANPLCQRWPGWDRRCRIEPFKRLARTINTRLTGILSGFEAGKHNGRVEVMKRALQEARTRARGDRRIENFIAMPVSSPGNLPICPPSRLPGWPSFHTKRSKPAVRNSAFGVIARP